MRGDSGLEALGDAKFLFRLEQPHGSTADGIDGGHILFMRGYVSIVDPLHRLQAAFRGEYRRDERRIMTEQSILLVEIGTSPMSEQDRWKVRESALCQILDKYLRRIGLPQNLLDGSEFLPSVSRRCA